MSELDELDLIECTEEEFKSEISCINNPSLPRRDDNLGNHPQEDSEDSQNIHTMTDSPLLRESPLSSTTSRGQSSQASTDSNFGGIGASQREVDVNTISSSPPQGPEGPQQGEQQNFQARKQITYDNRPYSGDDIQKITEFLFNLRDEVLVQNSKQFVARTNATRILGSILSNPLENIQQNRKVTDTNISEETKRCLQRVVFRLVFNDKTHWQSFEGQNLSEVLKGMLERLDKKLEKKKNDNNGGKKKKEGLDCLQKDVLTHLDKLLGLSIEYRRGEISRWIQFGGIPKNSGKMIRGESPAFEVFYRLIDQVQKKDDIVEKVQQYLEKKNQENPSDSRDTFRLPLDLDDSFLFKAYFSVRMLQHTHTSGMVDIAKIFYHEDFDGEKLKKFNQWCAALLCPDDLDENTCGTFKNMVGKVLSNIQGDSSTSSSSEGAGKRRRSGQGENTESSETRAFSKPRTDSLRFIFNFIVSLRPSLLGAFLQILKPILVLLISSRKRAITKENISRTAGLPQRREETDSTQSLEDACGVSVRFLTELSLDRNDIGDEGAKADAKALEICKNFKTLSLNQNNISHEGVKAVAKALEECENLTILSLDQNNIGDEGAKVLAKALEGCKNLTELNLHQNNIGDEGAKAVAKALEGCKNLTELNLLGNNIGSEGAKAVAKSLHKACPSVKIYIYGWRPLTPKRLFERVCSPAEDIADSSLDSDSCTYIEAAKCKPLLESKSEQDGVAGAGLATEPRGLDRSQQRLDGASVSFADVVQLAKKVSDLRADRGGVRGNSLQTGIALLEEFVRPTIQGYFGQVKLRQVSADIKNSKEGLDKLQSQIRASSADVLPSLIEKRNTERRHLHSLLQVVYPWVRANLCESDESAVREFKVRVESLVQDLKINLAPVDEDTSTDDFKHCQELVVQAVQCVEGYKRSGEGQLLNNIGERSQQAVKRVVSRLSELELGDGLSVALRTPDQAMELEPELSELESVLEEEIEALQGDTLRAQLCKIICAISSTFARFEGYSESSALNDASKCIPKELFELYDYAVLDLKEPSVSDVEALYQKLDKSRKATERLKRAREDVDAEDLDEEDRAYFRNRIKKQELILSQGNPIELSKAFRHKLAETLQHAQEHYPELLQDRAWLERLHVSAEGVFEVACSDLWLTNVTVSDFKPVGEPLASRGGKTVQKVLDGDGRTLVLKQFQLEHLSQSKTFYKQVANLGKVVSQHVIRITGAFVDMTHGAPRGCIVMPFYEQGDLAKWIESHPNEGKAARDRLAVGLLIGVADLHTHGIVHCDIKPENIFLTSNGTPLIGDFDGIKNADYTATYTSLQATPRYVAPELQNGPVDRFETAMDMYSVGISLKELYPTERTAAMQKLIDALTATDPGQRPTARQALQHEAFGPPKIPLKECLVCMEEHLLSEGTSCEEGDFLCRDCIESSIEEAAGPLANVRVDADGTMACMKPECSGRISGQEITRLAPTALNHLLLIAKMKAEMEAAVWAEKEIQRRIARVLRAGEQNSDAEHHLLHIQEKILSTCCPNCNAYVGDFDECCAVECINRACGHHFCAWCLGYSSQDADACHAHVRTCSRRLGQDLHFADSFEQVREAWRLLRAERLREYWNSKIQDSNLRLVLKELLSPLLTPDIVGANFRLE